MPILYPAMTSDDSIDRWILSAEENLSHALLYTSCVIIITIIIMIILSSLLQQPTTVLLLNCDSMRFSSYPKPSCTWRIWCTSISCSRFCKIWIRKLPARRKRFFIQHCTVVSTRTIMIPVNKILTLLLCQTYGAMILARQIHWFSRDFEIQK